jgi:hypothetical protein
MNIIPFNISDAAQFDAFYHRFRAIIHVYSAYFAIIFDPNVIAAERNQVIRSLLSVK